MKTDSGSSWQRSAGTLLLIVLGGTVAFSQTGADERVSRIQQDARYQQALEFTNEDYERFVDELIELTEIPAPPFKEEARAAAYLEKLRELGLQGVEIDAEGNVMGIRPGTGGGPLLAVAAHLDTVFPEGTEVTVKRRGTRLSATGIGDDTSGLAVLLAVIRAMDAAPRSDFK